MNRSAQLRSAFSSPLARAMCFLILVASWLWCISPFLNGQLFMGADNGQSLHWITYHFEHFIEGVYPFWDPFHGRGRYDYTQAHLIGEFNPLLLISPLFLSLGLPPYAAFLSFVILYAIVLFGGVYLLLRQLSVRSSLALLGTLLLMFSSIFSALIFWQMDLTTITAPMIWFFVFLQGFVSAKHRNRKRWNLAGMGLVVALALTAYIPYYFLTVVGCVLLACLICLPREVVRFFVALLKFLVTDPFFSLFLIALLCLTVFPSLRCLLALKDPQNVLLYGRTTESGVNSLEVGQQMIVNSGLLARASFAELFTDFRNASQHYVYISGLAYVLFLIAVWNRVTRRQVVIFLSGLFLFLIAATSATPVFDFLYQHLSFFRQFRNYYFFWPALIVMAIVLLIGELEKFLADLPQRGLRKAMLAFWVIAVHGGAALFLLHLQDSSPGTFVMLLASLLWFLTFLFWQPLRARPHVFVVILGFIALVQPIEVLGNFQGLAGRSRAVTEHQRLPMKFALERPRPSKELGSSYFLRPKLRKDDAGFYADDYFGQRGSYFLGKTIPKSVLEPYVMKKFVFYPAARLASASKADQGRLIAALSGNGPAVVEDARGVGGSMDGREVVLDAASFVKVRDFNANAVRLDVALPYRAFFVYNDSYHDQWTVTVDGKRQPLYRANGAFKGVWIDQGAHRVAFQFLSSWWNLYYYSIILINAIWVGSLVFSYRKLPE
ncbi:MAG: hypothetical protein HQL18_01560 [Candidatus Omnitrophica bacterium]|nr:hypothetical protein [Candidatus Omnitrophota bacterium]